MTSPRLPLFEPTKADSEAIVAACLSRLPADARPSSILLTGGFARGESGHYECDGKTLPFGDYDVDVVVPRPLLDSETAPVFEALEEELAYRSVTSPSEPTLVEDPTVFNTLDLRFKTPDEFLRRAPDLALFDLGESYHVLFGADVVAENPDRLAIGIEEVSPFSPFRILGNRLVLALKHLQVDYWERDPTRHEALALRLALCRTYLDLAGAIGFFHAGYSASYSGRIDFLKESEGVWRSWFPDTEAFLARLEKARAFKADPILENVSGQELWKEWFDLAHDVGRVWAHLIPILLLSQRIPFSDLTRSLVEAGKAGREDIAIRDPFAEDWKKLVAVQFRKYPSLYFRDFIRTYLARKGRNVPGFFCAQASRYYGVMEHVLWRGYKWVAKNPRRSTLAPTAFQSAALPLLLFSMNPKREVDVPALEFFDEAMKPYMLMPFDFLEPHKRWETTKRCFVHEMLAYRAKD